MTAYGEAGRAYDSFTDFSPLLYGHPPYSRPAGIRSGAIAMLAVVLPLVAAFLAYAPPLVDFAFAVVAAIAWTRGLERYPAPGLTVGDTDSSIHKATL